LTKLLQNKQGLKVGVVVNDVASVNIDSKLVRRQQQQQQQQQATANDCEDGTMDLKIASLSDGMVELQNGCACCSLSDELLNSVSELVTLSDLRRSKDDRFRHIVVELSGVADPKQVRAKFQEAALAEMPLMGRVRLDTLVTVVDVGMFESYFTSSKTASRKETPELFGQDPQQGEEEEGFLEEEEWMKDMPPKLLQAVLAGLRGPVEDESNGVADLLVSQTETADVVLLNKVDLINEEDELDRLNEIVAALNPRATILKTTYGEVPLQSILGVAKGEGVALSGAVDDHREYVTAALSSPSSASTVSAECTDPDCTDDSHTHSHSHSHHHEETSSPNCTDDSHTHSHSHHDHPEETSSHHDHSHDHNSDVCSERNIEASCNDPACTDPNHSHVHSHAPSSSGHAGIGTFVYRARRPFHPGRLVSFLKQLPVVRGIPEVGDDQDGSCNLVVSDSAKETLQSTLRSKGFCWCADSHASAMYWSQAGASFELSCLGQWWATLPRGQWPEGVEEYVLQDFDDRSHDDDSTATGSSSSTTSVGDRRQEVVFIGPQFDTSRKQEDIQQVLDQCLLTQEEYQDYRSVQSNEKELQVRFSNSMESKYVNF
jgi:G3E family GTPase